MSFPTQDVKVGGSSEGQAYPSQQAESEGRILHVYYEGWKYDKIRVTDSDKTSVLYAANVKMMKPQLTIQSTSTNTTLGTVDFHTFSSRIDATIHNQSISLTSSGLLKLKYSYNSPAFGNMKMTWEPRSKMNELKMVLVDDKANPIARFEPTNWAMQKTGKFELLGPSMSSQMAMDEVVMTGLCVIHYRQLQRGAAAAAAA
jgi:hypothetical protein